MMTSFFKGMFYPFRGFRFILRNKSLRLFSLFPFGIYIFLFAGFIFLGFLLFTFLTPSLVSTFPKFSEVVASTEGKYGALLVGAIIAFFLVSFFVTFFGNFLASPFNDLLSSRTEKLLEGAVKEESFNLKLFLKNAQFVIAQEMRKFLFIIFVQFSLLLIALLPMIGIPFYVVMASLISWLLFAFEFIDYSLSRKKMKFVEKRKLILKNWPLCAGFGFAVSIIMMLPLINFMLIPVAAVGATLLYCGELKNAEI